MSPARAQALDIQNGKLMRMLSNLLEKHENKTFYHDFSEEGVSPESIKASKAKTRKYGEEMRKLYEQEKKVNNCLNSLMEEFDVKHNKRSRKAFRKDMQKMNDAFNKMIYEARERYMKQLKGMVGDAGKNLKA